MCVCTFMWTSNPYGFKNMGFPLHSRHRFRPRVRACDCDVLSTGSERVICAKPLVVKGAPRNQRMIHWSPAMFARYRGTLKSGIPDATNTKMTSKLNTDGRDGQMKLSLVRGNKQTLCNAKNQDLAPIMQTPSLKRMAEATKWGISTVGTGARDKQANLCQFDEELKYFIGNICSTKNSVVLIKNSHA